MKKARLKKSACILLVLLMLNGCAKSQGNIHSKVVFDEPTYEWGKVTGKTITVWGDSGDLDRAYLTASFERYEKLTGNKIETINLNKKEIDQRVPQVFNSEDLAKPDILISYGGTNLDYLDANNNFYDFSEAEWINDLSDIALNQIIYNGKVIGFPSGEASISGTLYNKEIFKKYNLKIPTNQSEFMEICKKLLKNGITPVYLPYAVITMLLYQFPLDTIVQDSDILRALNDNSLSYTQIPEMATIFNWYKSMSDLGYFGSNYQLNDWDGMDDAMKSGKYAMMLCWDTWLYTNFTGDPSKIGIMPAFMGVPENGSFEGPNVSMFLVNKNSDNIEATLDFISFMADPYNYNVALKGIYTAPIFNNQIGSITTPQYMEAERLIDKHFYTSTSWLRIRGFSQIDALYIQKYMLGECSLYNCLEEMDHARINRAKQKD